jgi:hypothetical protein
MMEIDTYTSPWYKMKRLFIIFIQASWMRTKLIFIRKAVPMVLLQMRFIHLDGELNYLFGEKPKDYSTYRKLLQEALVIAAHMDLNIATADQLKRYREIFTMLANMQLETS